MTVSEVRKRFLDFYAARGHAIIPSAPIVPENDPTTLFTSSGMQPLVPYLMGQPHPEGVRIADAQLSVRTGDIEETGDNRHLTFFEMLGNWSLGDYFKAEQLPWIFEFLTSKEVGLGLNPENLYVTVFDGDPATGIEVDTEAVELWQRLFAEKGIEAPFVRLGTEEKGAELGMQGGRIFSYGDKNWWSRVGAPSKMPAGELGGPDSEVFYDFGLPHDPAFGAKCHPNCDCGRFVEICNSVFMQFIKKEDGSFGELPKKNVDFGGGLERLTATTMGSDDLYVVDVFDAPRAVLEQRSGKSYKEATRSFRIILDHTRAATFMLASGLRPESSEQGYILRRLIRRAIREADSLGIKEAVIAEIAEGYGTSYADQYPFVKEQMTLICEELAKEEERFRKTLDLGMREFDKFIESISLHGRVPHGGDTADEYEQPELPVDVAFTLFTSYGFPVELTEELAKEHGLVLDRASYDLAIEAHQNLSRAGAAQKFAGGLADHAEQTVRYHTAHHLLLKALQMVLGPDVHQRGSNITSERLRIDFSWGAKMTDEQKAEVERIVNEKIDEALPVTRTEMLKEEAEKLGAEHEFGASYPERVSVYSVGPKDATQEIPKINEAFSIEFCGGPHVSNTSELGAKGKHFKIKKEEASSAGIRRIKAVLE